VLVAVVKLLFFGKGLRPVSFII